MAGFQPNSACSIFPGTPHRGSVLASERVGARTPAKVTCTSELSTLDFGSQPIYTTQERSARKPAGRLTCSELLQRGWWTWRGSNPRPHDCQSCALPTAPQAPNGWIHTHLRLTRASLRCQFADHERAGDGREMIVRNPGTETTGNPSRILAEREGFIRREARDPERDVSQVERNPRSSGTSSVPTNPLRQNGGEGGIRTLPGSMPAVTYGFYVAAHAKFTMPAADACTLLHAGDARADGAAQSPRRAELQDT